MTSSRGVGVDQPLKFLILYRVDRLTTEQTLILKHASAIGEMFSEKALSAIVPDHLRAHLHESLLALVDDGMIFFAAERPVVVYGFTNELIRSTIYSTITPRCVPA